MPWVGMYIALASVFCVVAVGADLIRGLWNRKLWFPCKFFTLNAASLTTIAIATKLPVDLNNSMPGNLDQMAKLGSMAFKCTMMANFLPSLATMDSKELFANIIALAILQSDRISVEKLTQHVSNHWVMAETGSPQFITACSAATSASGFIGSLLGTAKIVKLSKNWIWNHIKVFNVESYWTGKLYDWRESSIPFSVTSGNAKIVIHYIKVAILTTCIGIQIIVVVACKMIALIPLFVVLLKSMYSDTSSVLEHNPESNNDHRRYVLQLQDSMELSQRTLKSILNYVDCSIQKAKKQQSNNLIKLLEESRSFEGVGKYDILQDPTSS
nr:pentatricopeptide repeat-containing protein [Tanacetum cinerariifolium]